MQWNKLQHLILGPNPSLFRVDSPLTFLVSHETDIARFAIPTDDFMLS